jgi:hypothetical protein
MQSSEAGPGIPDLATLTRQAKLVIVGRVQSAGTTRQVPQPIQTPIGPTRTAPGQPSAGISIPLTTYTVDVERVVRGGPPSGAQISVVQSGSPIRDALPSQDDVPMSQGERYVLFLEQSPTGALVTVGGVQGRLKIDAQGRIHPVGSGSPATRGRDGQQLDSFLAEVAAVP